MRARTPTPLPAHRTVVLLLLACATLLLLACSGAYQAEDADVEYEVRRAQPLTDRERILVGRWQGKSRQAEWEIQRHTDGTCELKQETILADSRRVTDYRRGIWGLVGNETYYFVDLECSDDVELGVRYTETLVELKDERFETVTTGDDGKDLVSVEKRVPGVFHVYF